VCEVPDNTRTTGPNGSGNQWRFYDLTVGGQWGSTAQAWGNGIRGRAWSDTTALGFCTVLTLTLNIVLKHHNSASAELKSRTCQNEKIVNPDTKNTVKWVS